MIKDVNERTLEENMKVLMKSHEEQSECMHKQDELMRKQNEHMQLIIQHIQMNNPYQALKVLLPVDIIKETILEMTVQKKINCMLNYIIDLTILTCFQ